MTVSLVMILAAFGSYALVIMRWFSSASKPSAGVAAAEAKAAAERELIIARHEFRQKLLDARAHLRLSEALWKAGRPVDSFYVLQHARQLFPETEFRDAHAQLTLGLGGPATRLRERLKDASDPVTVVPVHAQIAREFPATAEARESLDQLSRLAMGDENAAGGEGARLARAALEELYRDDPKNPERLAALAGAAFGKGDVATAVAMAEEARQNAPAHAGAARVLGMAALKERDLEAALGWLTAAWERNPNDLYAAAKLAQIYDKRRGDPESALPFYLALYRQNPDYVDDEPAEKVIRRTLDERRHNLLRDAPVAGLGGRFKLEDGSLRAEACLRAAEFQDPRWIEQLGELLDDDVEMVRRNADYALFQIAQKHAELVRAKRELWLDDARPLVRIRALNLFADLDGRNAIPAVAKALRDPVPAVRAYAVVMVVDHYYGGDADGRKTRERWKAEEQDPDVRGFVARHSRL